MNTGFLNWCRVLTSNRRKVLMIAQMLCITAVAAVFLAAPLVSLAACGGGGNKQATVKNLTVDGIVTGVSKTAPVGAPIQNLQVAIPGTLGGFASFIPANLALLKPGTWIHGVYKGVPFQGTIFSRSVVNGGTQVAEVWIADPAPNDQGVKTGLIIKNVDLSSLPKTVVSSASSTATN